MSDSKTDKKDKRGKRAQTDGDIVFEEETDGFGREKGDVVKKLKEELAACKKERGEYLEGWQRARADFQNYKKKTAEDVKEARTRAENALLESFFPVLDSFAMAFADKEAWEKVDEAWRRGVEHIHSQLRSVLDDCGVEETGKEGEVFDPAFHTSVEIVETDMRERDGTIAAVLQKGYVRRGYVLRPARVKVWRASAEARENENISKHKSE